MGQVISKAVMHRHYDIYVCKNQVEYDKLNKEHDFEHTYDDDCEGCFVRVKSKKLNSYVGIIYFNNPFDEGVVVHECVHAAEDFFRHIGEDMPSEEFRAYTINTLFNQVMEKLLN